MAIDLATGFNIGSKDAIDERQVLTLEQMKNLDETVYPDKYFAICKDNGKLYLYNASNEINDETGKFRVLSGGTGGGDTTYVLPPATDTTLGGVKVDNVTITVDSEGVITAINAYTKTEVDDLLNNKLDKPAVDGTAGQILVLQDDGSLAYADIPGSGNVDDIQEEIDKKLDKPAVDGTAGQILVLQDDGSLAYEDNVGSDTTDLTNVRKVFCDINEINNAKGTNISLVVGEDNTKKIIDVLEPNEVFVNWFNNETSYDRFGINSNIGTRINFISIQKYHDNNGAVIAITNKGKVLSRYIRNNTLSNWDYDTTDLTGINTKLTELENNQINKVNISNMSSTRLYLKITPSSADNFSKILMTDLYGGCVLITGSTVTNYKSFKVVRLSNGDWNNYLPSINTNNKIVYVYCDDSFIYVRFDNYSKIYIEGGFITTEKIDSIPSEATQLPILDLTQQTDLTEINTKISQLEDKAKLIPVVGDNPTDKDLNNYKENGNYSIGISDNYSNVPEKSSGLLTVIRSNTYRLQLYTVMTNNNVYFRKSDSWGKSWSSWALLNNSSGASNNGTNNDVYSTEEQAVGTWVNGKTLYRKTYTGTFYTSTGNSISLDDTVRSNYIVKIEGTIELDRNGTNNMTYRDMFQLPFYLNEDSVYVQRTRSYGTVSSYSLYLVYNLNSSRKYTGGNYKISLYYYK